ncbi:MAG: L-aspartate oxidase, partial [Gammaproteobacteria bacterium]
MQQLSCDVLIIGGGAAGLSLALHLAEKHSITLISKGKLTEGSTYYAQGGIAAVMDPEDSFDSHIADTLNAGAGLCDPEVVRYTVEQAPAAIQWLIDAGVRFTREEGPAEDGGGYHLTREGGHEHRRILHTDDATGQAVETTLYQRVQEHRNITVLEQHNAIDLVTSRKVGLPGHRCLGAYLLNRKSNRALVCRARFTVLATGGASKVYLYTSNPDTATGDGIAMAWRAGCRIANMEFNQFHPTCLYHPQAKSFLITEAMRGEGAKLLLPNGEPFMQRFDARAELAPRDIVARAIDHEMKRLGCESLFLDISHRPAEFITRHFPNIYKQCLAFGYDITRQPIPVVPAAHYTCGGVMTNLQGETDLPGLYAIGETTYTGLHGANRMASNSLLECLVFARSAAAHIEQQHDVAAPPVLPDWDESR